MPYSYTEKAHPQSFAKREDVQNVPFLLATQLQSYLTFLQADTAPSARSRRFAGGVYVDFPDR